MNRRYDIVVHGAGIPGLALALLMVRQSPLAKKPSILLLDRHVLQVDPAVHEKPESVSDFDSRVFALTYASKRLFEEAGVWPGDHDSRVYPYEHMHVWDAGGEGQIHFDAAEIGTPSLGYIIEGRVMQDWLIAAVLKEPAIEVLSGDQLIAVAESDDVLEIQLASGQTLHTPLLVGADGAQSHVRHLAGIEIGGWSYQQQAVVATVETELDHGGTAWQLFLPGGPLAFLPMQRPWCSIVWSVSEQRAEDLCEMPDEAFLQGLTADFQQRLGQVKAVGPRARFPLRLRHANTYIAPRIALVADAAHTVHPLAGQGLNLGLQDVSALATQLQQAWSGRQDIGSRRVLRAYERSRKADNWLMQGSFDGLKRLFSNEQALLTQLRNTGLNVIDQVPLVKNAFVRKAMGI
ncbi:MAG: UbiH/UbiF/VisC/COQ6 family ubiquinone biosynthesis hydroxylase [Gammaproteobacteria bacterium]|nr:UbiH/UbiF/VisC/COQ6 family ubiquinone biosynthesis hydroxylase [Gammaproteobacteria bacterium]